MLQTVDDNKSSFTKKELAATAKARELYQAIGRPGYKVFYDTLQHVLILHCPGTVQDAKNAYKIYMAQIKERSWEKPLEIHQSEWTQASYIIHHLISSRSINCISTPFLFFLQSHVTFICTPSKKLRIGKMQHCYSAFKKLSVCITAKASMYNLSWLTENFDTWQTVFQQSWNDSQLYCWLEKMSLKQSAEYVSLRSEFCTSIITG